MCNFYMYYYTDSLASLKLGGCYVSNRYAFDYPADSQIPMPQNLSLEREGQKLETQFGEIEDELCNLSTLLFYCINYTGVKSYNNWTQSDLKFGQIGGLALNPAGEILWVFHRSGRVWDGT